MGIMSWIKNKSAKHSYDRYKELGVYNAKFTKFGTDAFASDTVRSAIRPLAEHTSKATAKCSDKRIERILNGRPNVYMSGADMLRKVRTRLELNNAAFILINRNDKNQVESFYPIPYQSLEALEYQNRIFIKFYFSGAAERELIFAWDDLIALRKDYNLSDFVGDDNVPINEKLEVINTINQGSANAVKATANLRGIIKSKVAMLSNEDTKKMKDEFVKDYLNLENEGGIASLDASMEFVPIKMEPTIANAMTIKEYREDVYRYFGVNDNIVMSKFTEEEMEAFYSARIEPFLVALSVEMTQKIFTEREIGCGNYVIYEANKLQFASMKTKISIYKEIVLYKGMTINEWRAGCNMAPVTWGNDPIYRLDATQETEKAEDEKMEVAPVQQEEEEEKNNGSEG